jgi:Tfp pilus assembly protein PilN
VERRVIRFNYLAPNRFERLAVFAGSLREARLRGPLLAIALSLVLLGVVRGVEDWRITAVGIRLDSIRGREAATAATRKHVQLLSTDVARLEKIDEYVRAVRQSGTERAQELAAIGNTLPNHVWVTAIRDTENGWAITGGARDVADVASALLALERVPRIVSTTLVSTQGGDRDDLWVQFEMRLGRRR